MSKRKAYASDLSDSQWELIENLVPETKPGGRPPTHPRREVVHAILKVLRSGCAWRMMPHDLPPKETASGCLALRSRDGSWRLSEETWRLEGAQSRRQAARAHGGDQGQARRSRPVIQVGRAVWMLASQPLGASVISSLIPPA